MTQPPREDTSSAQPECLRDSPSLSPTPNTANSNAFSRRSVPCLDIPCTPPVAANSSRRKRPPGRCRSRASLHAGHLPGCCRLGQQGKQRARLLILLASHFPIVHRIAHSIPSLPGVVKFALVAAARPGQILTLLARTPRALQRREGRSLLAAGPLRRSPRAEEHLEGGRDSAGHPAAVGWILLCVIALSCSADAPVRFPINRALVDATLR
jgi:hypothetical protein